MTALGMHTSSEIPNGRKKLNGCRKIWRCSGFCIKSPAFTERISGKNTHTGCCLDHVVCSVDLLRTRFFSLWGLCPYMNWFGDSIWHVSGAFCDVMSRTLMHHLTRWSVQYKIVMVTVCMFSVSLELTEKLFMSTECFFVAYLIMNI